MNIKNLKIQLEKSLRITKWSPSENELKLIASRLRELPENSTRNDVSNIVLQVVGTYDCGLFEGVDNSDLTTLMLLATKPS